MSVIDDLDAWNGDSDVGSDISSDVSGSRPVNSMATQLSLDTLKEWQRDTSPITCDWIQLANDVARKKKFDRRWHLPKGITNPAVKVLWDRAMHAETPSGGDSSAVQPSATTTTFVCADCGATCKDQRGLSLHQTRWCKTAPPLAVVGTSAEATPPPSHHVLSTVKDVDSSFRPLVAAVGRVGVHGPAIALVFPPGLPPFTAASNDAVQVSLFRPSVQRALRQLGAAIQQEVDKMTSPGVTRARLLESFVKHGAPASDVVVKSTVNKWVSLFQAICEEDGRSDVGDHKTLLRGKPAGTCVFCDQPMLSGIPICAGHVKSWQMDGGAYALVGLSQVQDWSEGGKRKRNGKLQNTTRDLGRKRALAILTYLDSHTCLNLDADNNSLSEGSFEPAPAKRSKTAAPQA